MTVATILGSAVDTADGGPTELLILGGFVVLLSFAWFMFRRQRPATSSRQAKEPGEQPAEYLDS